MTTPSILSSFSTRPRRNVSIINYAEAGDDTPVSKRGPSGSGSGSANSRKRAAEAMTRVRQPKSLMKQIHQAALAAKGGITILEGDENEREDGGDLKLKKGRAAVVPLNFGASKKTQSKGPAPKYVANFLIGCEQIVSRDEDLLKAYQQALVKLLPINPANLDGIRKAMEGVLTQRVVERVSQCNKIAFQ